MGGVCAHCGVVLPPSDQTFGIIPIYGSAGDAVDLCEPCWQRFVDEQIAEAEKEAD